MAAEKPKMKGLTSLQAEAAGAYIESPKGAGSKKPHEEGKADGRARAPPLRKQRRRLSVVSDNSAIEGLAESEADADAAGGRSKSAVATYAGVSKKGYAPYNPRKKNQDSIIMEEDEATGALFLAALDGHGEVGDLVSQYFRKRLPTAVFRHEAFPEDPGRAMSDCVAAIEAELLSDRTIDTEFSGTTAVLSIIHRNELWVANVGDSRIILGCERDGRLVAEAVSRDHKPDLPDEKSRILAAGGRVFAVEYDDGIDGPARVWLGHMDIPGLAMSRSLGDEVAHSAGVTSETEVHHRKLTPEDKYLIMGSDGLWEFCGNEEVVEAARKFEHPMEAVRELIAESYSRWMAEEQVVDDTTVIVAHLAV